MGVGRFVGCLLLAMAVGAMSLSPETAGATPMEALHGAAHTPAPGAPSSCQTREPGTAAGGPAAKAAAGDCHDAIGAGATCAGGHCALCLALSSMPPPAIGDRRLDNLPAAMSPLRPGRCIAPATPPRIG